MKVALLTLLLGGAAVATPVTTQALTRSYSLNIPRQPLDGALRDLARQTGLQIARFSDTPGGSAIVGPISGEISMRQALNSLLVASGLTYRIINNHTIAVVARSQGGAPAARSSRTASGQQQAGRDPLRVAQASPPVLESQTRQLGEVIVTAEKRESTVQSTPISMTAVSGLEIQQRGLEGLRNIAQSVPGVSMRTSGPGQTEFEMRGIASTGGNSPTVGFYLDDIPVTAPATSSNGKVVIDPNLYDLNRIEVLRGPQGTLYGSGSMGGTIKVVTNAPDPNAFAASAELLPSHTQSGGFNHGENAMLNVPLVTGKAALRVVGTESFTSGWIDRIVIADDAFPLETDNNMVRGDVLAAPVAADYKRVNETELTGARAGLLWTPTDRFTVNALYFYQRIHQHGAGYIDSDPGTNAHYQPFDAPEPYYDYFHLAGLTLRYRLAPFDVTSTTSRWTRASTYYQDGAEEWQWALGFPSYYASQGGLGPLSPTPYELDTSKQLSEELRLTSRRNGKLEWLLGYFYSDFTSNQTAIFTAPDGAAIFGTADLFDFIAPTTIIQNSVFGELSYRITPRLKAAAGLRRYSYSEEVDQTEGGAVGPTGSDVNVHYHTSESDKGLNPKFSLSYEPNADLLVYGTAAKGFRPGGGTGPLPTSGSAVGDACEANLQSVFGTTGFVPTPQTFAPDTVWNYEIGEKLRALDRRMILNSAAYYANWKGVQQTIPLPCGYNFTANAGDAHIYGGEMEFEALLPSGFSVSFSVGYTHATLVSSTVLGVGVNPGTPVQEVPQWTSSQSIAYRHRLSDALALSARVENDYVGTRTDATYAINEVPAYDLTSIRAGLEGGQWSAFLFATNLLDKRAFLNDVTMINVNLPTYNRVAVAQPRTIGLDLSYRFGP